MTSFMNNRTMVPTHDPGILDFAPGAAAAYSLRNLSYTYTGPVVTVRRSTDNAEADFTSTEVSDGTLAAWCGGGDGFVKQWWDQSGNARHGLQATTAEQPQIVDSGGLVTEGGRAAIQFDGVNDWLQLTSTIDLIVASSFVVNRRRSTGTFGIVMSTTSGSSPYTPYEGSTENIFLHNGDTQLTVVGEAKAEQAIFSAFPPPNFSMYRNGAVLSGSVIPSATGSIANAIGRRQSQYGNGTISELLIYPADMTALRTRIEADMAWYY